MAEFEQRQQVRPALWQRWGNAAAGIAVTVLLATIGHFMISLHDESHISRDKVRLVAFGSSLRARINHELGAVLFPATGLANYLSARYGDLRNEEIQDMLENLYASSRHARNFALAIGYRVTHIHPLKGNEKVLGLDYTKQPDQWPHVQRAVDGGQPVLIGPVDLVQGGRALIYRVPISVRGKYWGLLSSVIDTDSLFKSVLADLGPRDISFAVRGRNGLGMLGDVFWGDAAYFKSPRSEIFEFDVPGGKWALALQIKPDPDAEHDHIFFYALVVLLALFLGSTAWIVLDQRTQLARMALYDPLTGLPNRHLVEDRIAQAVMTQARNRYTACALLFVDLDGFKSVNDAHGHRAGDALLQGVAKTLRNALRATDTVGRWGGDEFIVLMENIDRGKIPDLVDNVRAAVQTAVEHDAQALGVGASIGTALIPDDGTSVSDLVRAADARMYEDKQQRRSGG